MINTLEKCMAKADKARAQAERSSLTKVRERLFQSAQAWEAQAAIVRRYANLPSHVVAAQGSDPAAMPGSVRPLHQLLDAW
jgi:hypothetical protein